MFDGILGMKWDRWQTKSRKGAYPLFGFLFVRPRACLPIWSFSCSEKWNIGKQINHLLCGWLELLQLTVKTSNVIIMLVCQPH